MPMIRTYFKTKRAAPSITWPVPELLASYDWPTGLSEGGVIGIVELGGGWRQSDVDQFFKMNGQPSPTIIDVNIGSRNLPGISDADGEVALDLEVAGAAYFAATGKAATIRMYWADDIAAGVRAAARDGCDTCSISWGADEVIWGPAALDDMEAAAEEATAAGMVVFAAAGDSDADDGGGVAGVDAPASCPHVIACGGTRRLPDSETVWNDTPGDARGEGTGGGRSNHFPVPPWQVGIPVPLVGLGTGRMVPDVAANADPVTGYLIVVNGQLQSIGGTSAVAPLYAGLFAAFGHKLGFVTPKLWRHPECFNDITIGENGVYSAQKGPDACTGLGSPIGTKLSTLFAPPLRSTAKIPDIELDLAARISRLEVLVDQLRHGPTYLPGTGVDVTSRHDVGGGGH